jgi:hypothetical protein
VARIADQATEHGKRAKPLAEAPLPETPGHTTLVSYRDNTHDNIQIVQGVQRVFRRGRKRPHRTKQQALCRRESG